MKPAVPERFASRTAGFVSVYKVAGRADQAARTAVFFCARNFAIGDAATWAGSNWYRLANTRSDSWLSAKYCRPLGRGSSVATARRFSRSRRAGLFFTVGWERS